MEKGSIFKSNWLLWFSFAFLLCAFCLQYYVDFGNLLIRWNHEDFSYCYLVPFVFIYLVYINKEFLKAHELRPTLLGFAVLVFSGILYLGGKRGSIETLAYMSIWVAIVGLALLFLGIKIVKALAFPFLILGFIVPLPPFLNRLLTFKLKLISSALSVKMMQWGGLSVFRQGNIIDLGIIQLQVVDACSGLRYIYPLVLLGMIFAYLFHKKWWERAFIILATIPISVFSNVLRIAITGYLTTAVSHKVAEGFFHGFSGWLIFMISFVFLAILSRLLKITAQKFIREAPMTVKNGNPATSSFNLKNIRLSYLWIASILFLTFWGMNSAFATAQITPDRKTFNEFPTVIGEWEGKKTFIRKEILQELWADDYIQIQFHNTQTGDALLLFVPYYESQGTMHTAHSPVACLVGGGFAPQSREVIQKDFPPPFGRVQIRQMLFEKDRQLLLSNYWFAQRDRIIMSEYWNKWYLFWDSITKRRTDGALVRLEMPIREGQDIRVAQAAMDSFTQKLMKILPEYVPY